MSLKIGIISDTHLGAFALDENLGSDPFDAFEEGLRLLVDHGADIILHAGDFYHKAEPPPWVQDKATKILRSVITGKRPALKVISGDVNYQAEDVSIAVPVFIIHGTHDRPVGKPMPAPAFQHLVAAGYLNYVDANSENSFAARELVLEKDGIRISITGIGHRTVGDINNSISVSGVPARDDCLNFCMVHNCVEGVVQSEEEYLDLRHFTDVQYLIVGHAHQAHLANETLKVHSVASCPDTCLMVPGSTCATGIYPQEQGNKYVHLIELSNGKNPILKSFRIHSARRVFHASVNCDGLSAKEAIDRIEDTLSKLPLKNLQKKALVRLNLTGKLASGTKKTDLPLAKIAITYRDRVQNWNEMIVPSDLYTEDEIKRLEELRSAMQGETTLSAPFERFQQKLSELHFRGRHIKAEEIYDLLSEISGTTAARRRMMEKFNSVIESEHT